METVYIVYVVFGVWLLVLSALLWWIFRFFRRLSSDVKKGNLIKVLDKVLEKEVKNEKVLVKAQSEIRRIDEEGTLHVQKIGIVRFNPFKELGGDHSFCMALLDGRDTGIILTGLHTRERTRVYIRKVKKGVSERKLSNEEGKALKLAQKSK
jgi:hypothetical protein